MDQAEMTVGPKGQIVIPVEMRRALKIAPGSKVVVSYREGKVIIEKTGGSSVAVFARVAQEGPPLTEFDPHIAEKEIEERMRL
jgi:AbrB family looped-hinge helix DNA binding protein